MKFELPAHPQLHPYLAAVAASVDFGNTRLMRFIKDMSPEQLHATPSGFPNSAATLALHIAATHLSFAHSLKGAKIPADLKAEFKLDQPQSPLPTATGETLESLASKLERGTAMLVETLAELGEPDLTAEFPFGPENTATFPFVLGVVTLHPHQHIGQILMLRRALGL